MPPSAAPELVVIIQCESFADPVTLFGDTTLALPGLAAARAQATQWGDMYVSGFGAYTLRTEYAVLFGREEAELGFRRYDPFLTAMSETSYALPHRFGPGWNSLFLHPHDLRFYGRDRLMPAAGFTRLVGEAGFAPPGPDDGRYVTDAAMTDTILQQAAAATGPTLAYAVTIENHGPWAPDGSRDGDLVRSYVRLAAHGDAMLTRLIGGIAALKRPALLVFFGDHRPSIPGASVPGGERYTPYVMLSFDRDGEILRGDGKPVDLTAAALHHAILDSALGSSVD
jgi:phosphoglycerol transferase MdoB-like AlkP superfamily enzyme